MRCRNILCLAFALLLLLAAVHAETDEDAERNGLSPLDLYVEQLFAVGSAPVSRKAETDGLNATEKKLYDLFVQMAEDVAAGRKKETRLMLKLEDFGIKTGWTAEELGLSDLFGPGLDAALQEKVFSQIQYNMGRIMEYMLANEPYTLYWFDKVAGTFDSFFGGASFSGDTMILDYTYTFGFVVAQDYQDASAGEDAFVTVKKSEADRAVKAADAAKAIVKANADLPDYDKLLAYKKAICERVSYNHEALRNPPPFGDPWQLVWVFDGDASTRVVCEGYAKAFQYLFDLSTFEGDVACSLVSGMMGGGTGEGSHMWNVVRMPDEKNYLVDVTNCDTGSIGADDLLFLKGAASGSVSKGYVYRCHGNPVTYAYDSITLDLYDASQLTLSAADYDTGRIVSQGCEMEVNEEDGLTLIRYTGSETSVTLPNKVQGKVLTRIAGGAFRECEKLTGVTVPDGVKQIEGEAFQDCGSLLYVVLEGDPQVETEELSRSLLFFCLGKSEVLSTLKAGGWKAISLETVQPGGFRMLDLPKKTTQIQSSAFSGTGANVVRIPAGVKTVADAAFKGMKNLEFVIFEGAKTKISGKPFAGCDRVWLICPAGSKAETYASDNGIPVFQNSAWEKLFE